MKDYKITDRLIKDKKIAIVGGGPGGLTLARLLQQKGADVKVYERDEHKDVRVQGATLDLHEESGLAALEEGGLMDAFKANYRPGADKLRIVDNHGVIMHDENDEEESNRPEIDRGPLRKILLDSLEDGTVIWDSHFSCMVQAGDQWKIEFKNEAWSAAARHYRNSTYDYRNAGRSKSQTRPQNRGFRRNRIRPECTRAANCSCFGMGS